MNFPISNRLGSHDFAAGSILPDWWLLLYVVSSKFFEIESSMIVDDVWMLLHVVDSFSAATKLSHFAELKAAHKTHLNEMNNRTLVWRIDNKQQPSLEEPISNMHKTNLIDNFIVAYSTYKYMMNNRNWYFITIWVGWNPFLAFRWQYNNEAHRAHEAQMNVMFSVLCVNCILLIAENAANLKNTKYVISGTLQFQNTEHGTRNTFELNHYDYSIELSNKARHI